MVTADTLAWTGSRLQHQLVGVTPRPVFPRFEASNQRVMRAAEMFSGVLVGRRIAAADVAAGKAKPEMNPPAAGLEAFLTSSGSVGGHRTDLIEVGAGHNFLSNPLRSHPPRFAAAS